jgi:hypothetical protein
VDRRTFLDYCEQNDIVFIPWFPLAAGQLTGADSPLRRLAAQKNATPSQVALAWLLARSPVIVPIPGTSKVAHLVENVAAAAMTLTAISTGGGVHPPPGSPNRDHLLEHRNDDGRSCVQVGSPGARRMCSGCFRSLWTSIGFTRVSRQFPVKEFLSEIAHCVTTDTDGGVFERQSNALPILRWIVEV